MISFSSCRAVHSSIEPLEARIAPSVSVLGIGGTTAGTFTDSDGDVITVQISGTAGAVHVSDSMTTGNNDGTVDDGESIASVSITGASKDFVLTFLVHSTANSNGRVAMGDIKSDKTIFGVFTVADTTGGKVPASDFELGSFTGITFTKGGGLNVDGVVGSADGIMLSGGLPAGANLTVRNAWNGPVTIEGVFGGGVHLGSAGSGDIWHFTGGVTPSGSITAEGNFAAALTIDGSFLGTATIDGNATGAWTLNSVAKTGHLLAHEWSNVMVTKNFLGSLTASGDGKTSTGIALTVGGNLGNSAAVDSNNDLSLTVNGTLLPFVHAASAGNFTASLHGNVSNDVLTAGGTMSLTVGGGMVDSQVTSGGDLTLSTVAGLVCNALKSEQGSVTLSIGKSIADHTKISAATTAAVTVGGGMRESQVTSGGDLALSTVAGLVCNALKSEQGSVTLSIGKSITDHTGISAATTASLTVGGGMRESQVTSGGNLALSTVAGLVCNALKSEQGSVTLSIGKSITDHTGISAATTASLAVGGGMTESQVTSGGNFTLSTVAGMQCNELISMQGSVTVNAGTNVTGHSDFSASTDVMLTVGGAFSQSSVEAGGSLTATIHGNVMKSAFSPRQGLTLETMGAISSSHFDVEAGTFTIATGTDFLSSVATANGGTASVSSLTVGRNMQGGGIYNESGMLDLSVAGMLGTGTTVSSAGDLVASLGSLNGTIEAKRLDVKVNQSVGALAVIQAGSVLDLNNDDAAFTVAAAFAGRLDIANSLTTGKGASATLVGGTVASSAVFEIGSFGAGAAELKFAGAFLGSLTLASDLHANLTFAGNFAHGTIYGAIESTITVNGAIIGSLKTGSQFVATDTLNGVFKDGSGDITGQLNTTKGHGTVLPVI